MERSRTEPGPSLSRCLAARIVLGRPGTIGADDTADKVMQRALADALQARGTEALSALRSIDPVPLAESEASTRTCMLERLGARNVPSTELPDPVLAGVL